MNPDRKELTGEKLASRFVAAAATYRRTRAFSADMLVEFDEVGVIVRIRDGQVQAVEHVLPPLAAWDFALRGQGEAWWRFWQARPEPGWHDLFALTKRKLFRIEGQLQPLMANLQFIKDLAASPRSANATEPRP